jgi:hypothetical protein
MRWWSEWCAGLRLLHILLQFLKNSADNISLWFDWSGLVRVFEVEVRNGILGVV